MTRRAKQAGEAGTNEQTNERHVVSKKPNTPAIRKRRALVTPARPIPTEPPKLESPTAKPTSTTANTSGDAIANRLNDSTTRGGE
jgi:hypothetical protein